MKTHLGTNNYYVYGHYDGDELVYVGKGKNHRAWECGGVKSRIKEHLEWMQSVNLFEVVKPIALNLTEEEALLLEDSLMRELKPKFNRKGLYPSIIPIGEDNANAKLTEQDVQDIRYNLLAKQKMLHKDIATLYNISISQVSNISTGKSWSHV